LAILTLSLVERGLLSLDEPVCARWPEFAAGGKEAVTLRTLMSHRAGLPSVRARLPADAWQDWNAMCAALAAQEPWWEPGRAHGYHVNTYGFLVGELVRRATGLSPGHALRQLLGDPLDADFFWGLPEAHDARVAEVDVLQRVLSKPEQWAQAFPSTGDPERDTMIWHGYFNPSSLCGLGVMGSKAWLRAEVPSTNGQATAQGVARLYDALLSGVRRGAPLVGPGLLAEATQIHSDGEDRVLGRPSRFGLGFQLASADRKLGPNPEAFGHYGYGGLLGFVDPVAGVAFAFLSSRPGDRWQTPRTQALVDAVYAALGGRHPDSADM
jgi:CubicO group peptidase (beta-lactamase class C family)